MVAYHRDRYVRMPDKGRMQIQQKQRPPYNDHWKAKGDTTV